MDPNRYHNDPRWDDPQPEDVKDSLTTDSGIADAAGTPEIFPGTSEALNKLSVLPSKGQP